MKSLEDFVIEYTEYQIFCSDCACATDAENCSEDAVTEAEQIGFEIVGDDVLCPKCQEK